MMAKRMGEVVFDLETQHLFSEVGRDTSRLRVSVLGSYAYESGEYRSFEEAELPEFERMLKKASRVIGFNIKHFDYQVLQPYFSSLKLRSLPTLDLMEELSKTLGFRPRLNDLAKATLGVSKSGHGLEAIRWFQEGAMEKLKGYCLDDVRITKELYEFGKDKGYLMIPKGIQQRPEKVPVTWQTLPEVEELQPSLF